MFLPYSKSPQLRIFRHFWLFFLKIARNRPKSDFLTKNRATCFCPKNGVSIPPYKRLRPKIGIPGIAVLHDFSPPFSGLRPPIFHLQSQIFWSCFGVFFKKCPPLPHSMDPKNLFYAVPKSSSFIRQVWVKSKKTDRFSLYKKQALHLPRRCSTYDFVI